MNALVLFDAENQNKEIEDFKSWALKGHFDFRGYLIKEAIAPLTFEKADLFILLVGESTRYLNHQFTTDLESITGTTKPILCFNLNGVVALDEDHCPRCLFDVGAVHMPFAKEDVALTLAYIKPDARIQNPTQSFHFKKHFPPFEDY